MKSIYFLFCAAAVMMIASCGTNEPVAAVAAAPAFSLDSAKAIIEASNAVFMESFTKGDSAGVAGCYTKDAKLMPNGMPAITGTAAITGFVGATARMGFKNYTLATTDVWGNADLLGEEGTFALNDDKGNAIDKGKYIVLWKQEEGKWKMFRDIWTSDMPPPSSK